MLIIKSPLSLRLCGPYVLYNIPHYLCVSSPHAFIMGTSHDPHRGLSHDPHCGLSHDPLCRHHGSSHDPSLIYHARCLLFVGHRCVYCSLSGSIFPPPPPQFCQYKCCIHVLQNISKTIGRVLTLLANHFKSATLRELCFIFHTNPCATDFWLDHL